MTREEVYTVREVAQMIRVDETTVRRTLQQFAKTGEPLGFRTSVPRGDWRIPASGLERMKRLY
jgi:hypothetical protein